jgi:hypothetical protein
MAPVSKGLNELRFNIPKRFMTVFAQQPRVIIKWRPNGLWPVDPSILQKVNWNELVSDKEFNEQFEVVIMPRG